MKKIICDLCRKEITAADIHYNVPVTVDEDKIENVYSAIYEIAEKLA